MRTCNYHSPSTILESSRLASYAHTASRLHARSTIPSSVLASHSHYHVRMYVFRHGQSRSPLCVPFHSSYILQGAYTGLHLPPLAPYARTARCLRARGITPYVQLPSDNHSHVRTFSHVRAFCISVTFSIFLTATIMCACTSSAMAMAVALCASLPAPRAFAWVFALGFLSRHDRNRATRSWCILHTYTVTATYVCNMQICTSM
jgi:hypothetical protein